jgi:hypothetical protein
MVNVEKARFACPQKIPIGKFCFQFIKTERAFIDIFYGVKESAPVGAFNVYNISGFKNIVPFVFAARQFHIQHSDSGKQFLNIISHTVTDNRDFGLRTLFIGIDGDFHISDYRPYRILTQENITDPPEFMPELPFLTSELHWQIKYA